MLFLSPRRAVVVGVFVLTAMLGAPGGLATFGAHAAPAVAQTRIGPQSGLPVPRFVSLKYDLSRGRDGPSDGHPVVWLYRLRGLPMQVIEEDVVYWRVRDLDGDEVWMHRRLLINRRMGVVVGADAELKRRPASDSQTVAVAEPGVLFEIEECRGNWLRVDGARATGWIRDSALWGASCG